MLTFQVQDMTCGHCVKAITTAVQRVDAGAMLEFDLASHQVRIEPVQAGAQALREAMMSAGYTAVLTSAASIAEANASAPAARRCCCS